MEFDPHKIRLFVEGALQEGLQAGLSAEQCHYLGKVMRRKPGDHIYLFNGRDGEWRARIATMKKKEGACIVEQQTRPQQDCLPLTLAFAIVKRTPLETIVQKATELGVTTLQPMRTERTVVKRINFDRLRAIAIEAAEQCERLDTPAVQSVEPLDDVLGRLPETDLLVFCDESGNGVPPQEIKAIAGTGRCATILVGPEGGFTEGERARIGCHPGAVALSLGPRILRADTAAISALTLWQAMAGDWK